MFSPLPCGRVGRIGRIRKDFRGHQFVAFAKQRLGRVGQKTHVDGVSPLLGFAQCPERQRYVMAGGTLSCLQPGGAFELQISNRPLDRLVNLFANLRRCSR